MTLTTRKPVPLVKSGDPPHICFAASNPAYFKPTSLQELTDLFVVLSPLKMDVAKNCAGPFEWAILFSWLPLAIIPVGPFD